MSRLLLTLALVSSLCCSGCLFQGQGRSEALADAVHGMVDESRWGNAELAADRVAPAFRERFVHARAHWGQGIEIADVDLAMIRMARDEESATAILSVSWYALGTMDLSTTRIRQRWEQRGGNYVLVRESVMGGDPRLLDAPTAPAPTIAPRAPRTEASGSRTDG